MGNASTTQSEETPIILRIRLFARIAVGTALCAAVISAVFGRKLYRAFPSVFGLLPIIGTIGVLVVIGSLVLAYRKSNPQPVQWVKKDLWQLLAVTGVVTGLCVVLAESLIVNETERIHFFKYGLLCLFTYFSQAKGSVRRRLIIATIFAAFVGSCEEGLQYFVPERVSELRDVRLNVVGALFGAVFTWLTLQWQQIGSK